MEILLGACAFVIYLGGGWYLEAEGRGSSSGLNWGFDISLVYLVIYFLVMGTAVLLVLAVPVLLVFAPELGLTRWVATAPAAGLLGLYLGFAASDAYRDRQIRAWRRREDMRVREERLRARLTYTHPVPRARRR